MVGLHGGVFMPGYIIKVGIKWDLMFGIYAQGNFYDEAIRGSPPSTMMFK